MAYPPHEPKSMSSYLLDIASLAEACEEAISDILESYEGGAQASDEAVSPSLLASAMNQLMEVLKRIDADTRRGALPTQGRRDDDHLDISELGDYGFTLFNDMMFWAQRLGLLARHRQMETLVFPFALWLARHGSELRNLETVVNALAVVANSTNDHAKLEQICAAMGEIINAVSPSIQQDLDNSNPGRPWRLLIINRAIVATRTHNPAVMEAAFKLLVNHLPDDAPEFFSEGMGQMEALNYPAPVREIMEKYYRHWSLSRILH